MNDFEFWPSAKDPDSTLDYIVDWKARSNGRGPDNWLSAGEFIVSHVVTVEVGLTLVETELIDADTALKIWLSGGTGKSHKVHCRITTNSSPIARIDERTIILLIKPK